MFVNDPRTNELLSRSSIGGLQREIRILNTAGIAGLCFQTGESLLIDDAQNDSRFNSGVDEQTGYTTHAIGCVPLRTLSGELIGVIEVLNKNGCASFSAQDLDLLLAISLQASESLQRTLLLKQQEEERHREAEFMDVVADLSGEIKLEKSSWGVCWRGFLQRSLAYSMRSDQPCFSMMRTLRSFIQRLVKDLVLQEFDSPII